MYNKTITIESTVLKKGKNASTTLSKGWIVIALYLVAKTFVNLIQFLTTSRVNIRQRENHLLYATLLHFRRKIII